MSTAGGLRSLSRRQVSCGLACLTIVGGSLAAADPAEASFRAPSGSRAKDSPTFTVFDGLLYEPMPDLRPLGMPKLLGTGNVWRLGFPRDLVDPPAVAEAAQFLRRYTRTYYLDIENWLPPDDAPDGVTEADVAKFMEVARIARAAVPDGKFGFYGILPKRTYWPFVLKRAAIIDAWRHMNDVSAPLAALVDYLFPSLYTFYDDPAGWETAARPILNEARRYGKPVYPFLWPEFHNSNRLLAGKEIPRAFWRRELEFCREHADGLVLWGGAGERWDERAGWWQEALSFLRSLKIGMDNRAVGWIVP